MSFRQLPGWVKVGVIGTVGLGVGAFVYYRVYPFNAELYKIWAKLPQADNHTVERIEKAWQKLQEAKECNSLLKKHFTKEVLDKCKKRKTYLGATLLDVIQSGISNLDSGVGVYAPDAESYRTFKELFDPIIEDYHKGFGPGDKQPPTDLGESKLDYFKTLDPEGKYILSTRIRCGRSIKKFPFNPLLREDDYLVLEQRIKDALLTMPDRELQGSYYPLTGMSKDTQQQLIKDHFLFKEGDRFLQAANACRYWPTGRGIYHNKDKTFLVWVNEEDHMRIISMQNGGNVSQVLDRLIRAVKAIESKVPFSRDDRLGWLTFCPSNLGTTVRASVHIKLPKTSARKDFKKICEAMNLQVRGIHGEHSESEDSSMIASCATSLGGVFDISNIQRMGKSFTEFEAVKQMYDGVKRLIEIEEGRE